MNCLEYQERQRTHENDLAITYQALQDIVKRGLGMQCPKCMVRYSIPFFQFSICIASKNCNIFHWIQILIMKRDGCDWLRCAMCKTEICWATKQSRWGPGGRGDTSGGCKCSSKNKCSPQCKGCH